MTWVKNLKALLLVLVAVAAVAFLVALLVDNVQTDRRWQDFVLEITDQAGVAEQAIGDATEIADLGERVGVTDADLAPLRDQIEESQLLLNDLRGLEEHIVEDDLHALSDEEDDGAENGAAVDPYGTPDTAGVPLIVPPHSRTIVAQYSAIAEDLEESLDELAVLTEQVSSAISSHTGELLAAVSLAREALTYQIIRGQILTEYAVNQGLSDDELAQLREAVDQGQAVQQDYRILDKEDSVLLAKALELMERATEEIRLAVSGLVDKIDTNPDDLLDLINPEELLDDDNWVPPATPEAGENGAGQATTPVAPPAAPVPPTAPETENPNPEPPETDLPEPPETEEPDAGEADAEAVAEA